MTDLQTVEFTKMQGTGNDFIVLDNRRYRFSRKQLSNLAASWCPRRFGVGADGLLALDDPTIPEAEYRMQYVNSDGSRATMCGNGARCLARFARQHGFELSELAFETDAGLYRAEVSDVESGPVRLFVPDVTDVQSTVNLQRERPMGIDRLCYAHAGTEHLVAFVDDLEAVPVNAWGKQLRQDPSLAPAGANVNFLRTSGEGELHVRTYEKGVEGETLSCGTGVLAAAAVAAQLGQIDDGEPVTVRTEGGSLQVGIANTDRGPERYLEGPAIPVFRGTIERSGSE